MNPNNGRIEEKYSNDDFIQAIKNVNAKNVYSGVMLSDIANEIGCHKDTARRRINKLFASGLIQGHKIGNNWVYWV